MEQALIEQAEAEEIAQAAGFLASRHAQEHQQYLKTPYAQATGCLAVLKDRQWHRAGEIAEVLGLAPGRVQQLLQALQPSVPGLTAGGVQGEQGEQGEQRESYWCWLPGDRHTENLPAWFVGVITGLRLLPKELPDLERVQRVLAEHLGEEYRRLRAYVSDEADPLCWLAVVLKARTLVELRAGEVEEESADPTVRLAVQPLASLEQARALVHLVEQEAYQRVREALGIRQQLFMVFRGLVRPAAHQLLDPLFDFADSGQPVGLIDCG